jgi:hypothetical protein
MYSCVRDFSAVIFVGLIGFTGCVKVPDLKPIANSSEGPTKGSISIEEIVKRVKCEIRDSLADRGGPLYKWLDKWTISADLSLTVSDNSQISPGVVLTHQFLLGNIPGRITNSPQSSSLGLGGQASTTASRTEIVSFSMSVKEVRKEFFFKNTNIVDPSAAGLPYNFCEPYGPLPRDLTGSLGLKQWVESAFGPVTDVVEGTERHPKRYLLAEGQHSPPKPPSGGGGNASPGANVAMVKELLLDRSVPSAITDALKAAENEGVPPNLKDALIEARKKFGDVQAAQDGLAPFKTTVDRLTDLQQAGAALSPQDKAEIKDAQENVRERSKTLLTLQRDALTDITDLLPELEAANCCTTIISQLKNQRTNLVKAIPKPTKPKLDPPIDAISHQVQFTIAYNASANPTWTMLNFKGPSPTSGNFFSAMATNIHTLTIVMGEPSSAAVNNQRSALNLSTALTTLVAPAAATATTLAPIF